MYDTLNRRFPTVGFCFQVVVNNFFLYLILGNGTEYTLACILLLFQGQFLKINCFILLPLMDNKHMHCEGFLSRSCLFVCLFFVCLFFLPWDSFQFTYCVSEHFDYDELVSCVLSLSLN